MSPLQLREASRDPTQARAGRPGHPTRASSVRLAYCRQRLAAASRCLSGSMTTTWRPCAIGSSSSRALCVGPRGLGGRINVLGPLRRPALGPGSPDTGAGSGRAVLAVSPGSRALCHAASRRRAPFVRASVPDPRAVTSGAGLGISVAVAEWTTVDDASLTWAAFEDITVENLLVLFNIQLNGVLGGDAEFDPVDCPHCSLSTPPLHAIPARLRRLRAHLLLLLRARVAGPRDACRGWGRSRFNRACCAAGGRFNYAQALGKQPVGTWSRSPSANATSPAKLGPAHPFQASAAEQRQSAKGASTSPERSAASHAATVTESAAKAATREGAVDASAAASRRFSHTTIGD
ncbi:hypothetical protein T492DRAFT_894534 [Pavlovales sp. CCMP2436]|nr:hypothetical protein T492DRAFT_894534 [Pavlovales sp. CCMP2436]